MRTIRFASVFPEGDFSVHYSRDARAWPPLDVDDAFTLEDARKLATARQGLGYKTKIIEKRTGTEVA